MLKLNCVFFRLLWVVLGKTGVKTEKQFFVCLPKPAVLQQNTRNVLHCRGHRNETRRFLKCVGGECKRTFRTYAAFSSFFQRQQYRQLLQRCKIAWVGAELTLHSLLKIDMSLTDDAIAKNLCLCETFRSVLCLSSGIAENNIFMSADIQKDDRKVCLLHPGETNGKQFIGIRIWCDNRLVKHTKMILVTWVMDKVQPVLHWKSRMSEANSLPGCVWNGHSPGFF